MTTRNRDFDRAFNVALAFHVAEIDVVILMRGKKSGEIAARRQKRKLAAEKLKCLSQVLDAV